MLNAECYSAALFMSTLCPVFSARKARKLQHIYNTNSFKVLSIKIIYLDNNKEKQHKNVFMRNLLEVNSRSAASACLDLKVPCGVPFYK